MATETAKTGRESDKFMLRLPDGMRDRLKAAAEDANRTINAEVVERLRASFEDGVSEFVAAQQFKRESLLRLQIERLVAERAAMAASYLALDAAVDLGDAAKARSSALFQGMRKQAEVFEQAASKMDDEAVIGEFRKAIETLANAQQLMLARPTSAKSTTDRTGRTSKTRNSKA